MVFAGRFNTVFRGLGIDSLNLSFMYANKPLDGAVSTFKGIVPDPITGIKVINDGEHPRVHIFGASANYYIDFLKTMIRGEMTFTPNQPYQKAPLAMEIEDRGTYNVVIGVDRNFKLFPHLDSLSVGLQFFEMYILGNKKTILINNANVPKNNKENIAAFISQPIKELFGKRLGGIISLDFLVLYDFDKAYWLQPGIRYDLGDHWRFGLFANIFNGTGNGNLPGRVGNLGYADEIFLRITYGF
jgi:hypothetical protein